MSGRVRVENPLRTSQDPAQQQSSPLGEPPTPATPDVLPLRELTGWEEEFLERRQHEPNTARTCNEVLAMCCVAPGSLPDEAVRDRVRALLVAERDRELVRLRRMSIGPDVEATVVCPSCGGTIEASFSLDTLELDVQLPRRRTGIPLDDPDGLTLDLPTAGDQEELLDAGDRQPGRAPYLAPRPVPEGRRGRPARHGGGAGAAGAASLRARGSGRRARARPRPRHGRDVRALRRRFHLAVRRRCLFFSS